MKLRQLSLLFASAALLTPATVALAQATCTHTGFIRDGLDLTAALINPKSTISTDVDGTNCNIVIYYGPGSNGQVNGANIHGANYYGIVNNGGNVNIQNSTISDIGEKPLNGTQHGVGIYFAFGSNAQGNIQNNILWNYQKGGIVVNGPLAKSNIQNNQVIGQGPVNFIAQNGIQLGYGAQGNIQGNLVVGNSYTGANLASSGGIIEVGGDCYGGPTVTHSNVQQNIVIGNDVGVWFSFLDASCNPVSTPTQDQAQNNTIDNNGINNTTGDGPTQGYQAGITDEGDQDSIQNNSICGIGYTPTSNPAFFLIPIDTTFTNNPKVQNNNVCAAAPVLAPAVHSNLLLAPTAPPSTAPVHSTIFLGQDASPSTITVHSNLSIGPPVTSQQARPSVTQ